MGQIKSPAELETRRKDILSKRDDTKPRITLCSGTGCRAYGSEKVYARFEEVIKARKLEGKIDLKRTGCHGFCERGTLVVIHPDEVCYIQVQQEDVEEVVASVEEAKVIDRLLYIDPVTGEKVIHESDIPFYKNQNRLIFGPNRKIDPKEY